MTSRLERLVRLQVIFAEMRKAVERDIAAALAARRALLDQQSEIDLALRRQQVFGDLVTPAAIRALARLGAEIAACDVVIATHRAKATSIFLKAGRARETATRLARHRADLVARADLDELTARASLPQAD